MKGRCLLEPSDDERMGLPQNSSKYMDDLEAMIDRKSEEIEALKAQVEQFRDLIVSLGDQELRYVLQNRFHNGKLINACIEDIINKAD